MPSCRVIVHIDLDCFYAQVEAIRLGIDFRNEPYVLSQWGGLIAVNYPARAVGITRFETLNDAIKKCPDLKYSHVATFEVGDPVYRYHPRPDKSHHKVALDPYRRASKQIFDILGTFEGVVVEKGGIDEAFLDVTAASMVEVQRARGDGTNSKTIDAQDVAAFTMFCPDRSDALMAFLVAQGIAEVEDFAPHGSADYVELLYAACLVVQRIRDKVRADLGFDCSAGISHNRMLSKCISALFKPNQQTLLLPQHTLGFLFDFKFTKLRMFGGKLGQVVSEALCSSTCGDLWRFDADQMGKALGDAELGLSIYRRVRGHDDQVVAPRSLSKSLLAQKVFAPATSDASALRMWFVVLAQELVERLREFGEDNGVAAHALNVKLGQGGLMDGSDAGNKTFPLPTPTTAEALTRVAMQFASTTLANRAGLKINAVSLTISEFRKSRHDDVLSFGQQTLDGMFSRKRGRQAAVGQVSDEPDDVIVIESIGTHRGASKVVPREIVVVEDDDDA